VFEKGSLIGLFALLHQQQLTVQALDLSLMFVLNKQRAMCVWCRGLTISKAHV